MVMAPNDADPWNRMDFAPDLVSVIQRWVKYVEMGWHPEAADALRTRLSAKHHCFPDEQQPGRFYVHVRKNTALEVVCRCGNTDVLGPNTCTSPAVFDIAVRLMVNDAYTPEYRVRRKSNLEARSEDAYGTATTLILGEVQRLRSAHILGLLNFIQAALPATQLAGFV